MKLKGKLNLLIFESSIYVSLQAALYIIISSLFFSIQTDWILFLIVFMNAFFVYTINKYTDIEEDKINKPFRYEFFMKYRKIVIPLAIISIILSVFLSLFYSPIIVFLTILPFILGIFYSIKLIPHSISKNKRRLKDIFLGKNFTVSFGWATRVLYILPLIGLKIELISFFFYVLILEFIANIAFDVRDVEGDKITGIKTLPAAIGVHKSLLVMFLLSLIATLFAISLFILNIMTIKIVLISLGMLIFNIFVIRMIPKTFDKTFIYDFLAESLTIVMLALVVIATMLNL